MRKTGNYSNNSAKVKYYFKLDELQIAMNRLPDVGGGGADYKLRILVE